MIRGNGSEPEDQSREREHREEVHGPLFKAGGTRRYAFKRPTNRSIRFRLR